MGNDYRLNGPRDGGRINRQFQAVSRIMHDGKWHTLPEMRETLKGWGVHADVAAISARVRDLRKTKFGGHVVERRHIEGGLWAYRLKESLAAAA